MNYYDSIEKVIDYIEENLKEELNLDELAKIACMSEFHFHRIFSFVTGETIMKYIRQRRLTKASEELLNSNKNIIEIGFDYGYESQESFTRSFKAMFEETPKKFRNRNERNFFTNYRSKFDLKKIKIMRGEVEMKYKLVEREKMIIVGMECITNITENKEKHVIPKLWDEFNSKMRGIQNQSNGREFFGICGEVKDFDPTVKMGEDINFKYLAGVEVNSKEAVPEEMKVIEIPKQKFVVFTHRGTLDTLHDTYNAIYKKGFPESGFELDKAYDFELYDERYTNPVDPNCEFDIYIPIK